jgi:hypothetical protein
MRRPSATPHYRHGPSNAEILAQLQGMSDSFVGRREYDTQNDRLASALGKLEAAINDLARSQRDYVPNHQYERLEAKVDGLRADMESLANRTAGRFLTSASNQYTALIYIICAVVGGTVTKLFIK